MTHVWYIVRYPIHEISMIIIETIRGVFGIITDMKYVFVGSRVSSKRRVGPSVSIVHYRGWQLGSILTTCPVEPEA